MEYRRRKRPRFKRRASRGSDSVGGGKLILTLVLLGGAVYLLSASAAGTWLAQNVMAPIFSAFSPSTSEGTPVISTDSVEGAAEAEELKLSGMKVYLLQLGVYSTEDSAKDIASEYKPRGAGGYILEKDGKYRVIATAYSEKSEARSVQDRLSGEGVDTAVHELSLNEISFNVTADSASREAISEGFSCLSGTLSDMINFSQEFDSESMSVSAGKEKLKAYLEEIKSKRDALTKTGADDAVINAVKDCFGKYITSMEAVCSYGGDNTAEMSSAIKYTLISMIDEYSHLINSLSV